MCDTHRRAFLTRSILVMGAVAAGGSLAIAAAQTPPATTTSAKWVCPPCGCPADGKEFDKPGSCPACGMTLIQKPEAKLDTAAKPGAAPAATPSPKPQ